MPSPNTTNITPPRVPFLDERTGLITREWYRFLLNMFIKVQGSAISLDDLQVAPPATATAVAALTGDNIDLVSVAPRRADFRKIVPPTHKEGRLFYSAPDYALSYYNENDEVTVNIGREELVRVYNASGGDILNGQAVYIDGSTDGWPTIMLAQADTYVGSQSTLGLATCDIPNNSFGYICTSGLVNEVDTTGYLAGSIIYLSATVAGGWTLTSPLQPDYDVVLGIVISTGVLGKIFVHVDKQQWYPSVEILDTTASTALPTVATVFVAPTVAYNNGFSYDASTGILTFNTSGAFSLALVMNAEPSAANKNIYFYVEENTGSGWTPIRYSARLVQLTNAVATQVTLAASRYFTTGTQLRFYVWGDATVTLKTTDLPGTTAGTVTLPAFQLMLA